MRRLVSLASRLARPAYHAVTWRPPHAAALHGRIRCSLDLTNTTLLQIHRRCAAPEARLSARCPTRAFQTAHCHLDVATLAVVGIPVTKSPSAVPSRLHIFRPALAAYAGLARPGMKLRPAFPHLHASIGAHGREPDSLRGSDIDVLFWHG